jgi:hypothetical protein
LAGIRPDELYSFIQNPLKSLSQGADRNPKSEIPSLKEGIKGNFFVSSKCYIMVSEIGRLCQHYLARFAAMFG